MEGSVVQWKEQSSWVTLNKSFNLSAPQTIKMESAYHRRLSDPEREDASVFATRRWFTAPYHFIVHHSELSDRAPAISPSGELCAHQPGTTMSGTDRCLVDSLLRDFLLP